MPTINGKEVIFREHFPAKDFWDLPAKIAKLARMRAGQEEFDMKLAIPLLTRLIESWEHEGDPADESSYDDLDILGDILPLVQVATDLLNRMVGRVGE